MEVKQGIKRKRDGDEAPSAEGTAVPQNALTLSVGVPSVTFADECGARTMGPDGRFLKCTEKRSNAVKLESGTVICPVCNTTSPEMVNVEDMFLPDLIHTGQYAGMDLSNSLADVDHHLENAQQFISNVTRNLSLSKLVERKAMDMFRQMLTFVKANSKSKKTRQEKKTDPTATPPMQAGSSGTSSTTLGTLGTASATGPTAAQKGKAKKKKTPRVSGKRYELLVAIVELCALQHGTPRFHHEYATSSGVPDHMIQTCFRMLKKEKRAKELGIDSSYQQSKVDEGFVRLIWGRALAASSSSPEVQDGYASIYDVTTTSYWQEDEVRRIVLLADLYCGLLAAPTSKQDHQQESSNKDSKETKKEKDSKMVDDDEDSDVEKLARRPKGDPKKLPANLEALPAAAALLAATETSPMYRQRLSYSILRERFGFMSTNPIKALYEKLRVLSSTGQHNQNEQRPMDTSVAVAVAPVQAYGRRAKRKSIKRSRGIVPPRVATSTLFASSFGF